MTDYIVIGGLIGAFLCGLAVGIAIRPMSASPNEDKPAPILVKRTRASFRHPGKTSVTDYEEYRSKNGLYAPVRPGKGSTANEKEVK